MPPQPSPVGWERELNSKRRNTRALQTVCEFDCGYAWPVFSVLVAALPALPRCVPALLRRFVDSFSRALCGAFPVRMHDRAPRSLIPRNV
jgi:hypothetical protein